MAQPFVSSTKLPTGDGEFSMHDGGSWLDGLTEVNIFVGANNTGKSRLMRGIFRDFMNKTVSVGSGFDRREVMRRFAETARKTFGKSSNPGGIALASLLTNGEKGWVPHPLETFPRFRSELTVDVQNYGHMQANIFAECDDWLARTQETVKLCSNEVQCVYMPPIRTARADLSEQMDDAGSKHFSSLSRGKTLAGEKLDVNRSIWSGEQLHRTLKLALLGDHPNREKVRDFERFLTESFFDGSSITLIPREEYGREPNSLERIVSRTLYVKIGDERERSILELGDGVQQVILLTWPIFEHSGHPLALFIEEPELYLHPGMQRKLMDVFLSGSPKTKQLQVFMATHSHTFLDRTFDESKVSVFRLSKSLHGDDKSQQIAKFQLRRLSGPDFSLLHELGVTNSSVMLANSTIWVEGITDRMYLRKWLKLLLESKKEQLTEDIHYAFMEYGGGNITHWSFLDAVEANGLDGVAKENRRINVDALCAELFLIADSDGAEPDSEKARRLLQLKAKLGNRFAQHDSVEVENLLTRDCILATLQRLGRDVSGAPDFSQSDYSNIRLGKFIVEVIMAGKKMPDSFQLKTGSINKKVDFATAAMDCMGKWADLSPEAQVLTEKVYGFIRNKNPR